MKASTLQTRIFESILARGAATDERLERLSKFRRYAKSTIRTRRHELAEAGKLKQVGTVTGSRGRPVALWAPK
jgi:hypothetical protein